MMLRELFGVAKPVIGMLHVPPLPGSPAHILSFDRIHDWVLRDAEALVAGGVHGLILENFGDAPFYPNRVPPHTVAFLTALGREVKGRFAVPMGINVLRNDARSALAIAVAAGAAFVRVNVYTGARLTDQGIIQGEAHRILRYRKLLGSEVRIFADVAVKHSSPLSQRDVREEAADAVSRGRADAILVSGPATGQEPSPDDVRAAKEGAGDIPVLAGSGAHPGNLDGLLALADGLIAGSALKKDGVTTNPVDPARVRQFMERWKGIALQYSS